MAAEQTPGTPTPTPTTRASISERMEAKGWTPEDVGEGSNGEPRKDVSPDAAPAKAKPAGKKPPAKAKPVEAQPTETPETEAEAKPEPVVEEKTDADKLGARGLLEKLAKEQGYVVEDGKITTKQQAEWRLMKKEQREQLARAEKDAMGRIEAAQKGLEERYKRVEAYETAIKSRDHQALAKALGYEDWDKLQTDIVAWNSDPNYQAMQELRQWKAQQEAEAERAAQERQQQAQHAARQQAEAKYLGDLSGAMKASQDPLVQSMSEDPLFLRAVYRIQQENWDGRETVTPEQAIRMAANGSRVTLNEELKALHARLDKAFGKKPEAEAPKPPAPKPKIASGGKPPPSLPARTSSRQDRMRNYAARLEEASQRDSKSGSAY